MLCFECLQSIHVHIYQFLKELSTKTKHLFFFGKVRVFFFIFFHVFFFGFLSTDNLFDQHFPIGTEGRLNVSKYFFKKIIMIIITLWCYIWGKFFLLLSLCIHFVLKVVRFFFSNVIVLLASTKTPYHMLSFRML